MKKNNKNLKKIRRWLFSVYLGHTFVYVVPGSRLQQHDVVAEVYVPVVPRRRHSAPLAILLRPQPQLLHPAAPGQSQPVGRGHALQMRHFQHQLAVVHPVQKARRPRTTKRSRPTGRRLSVR